ncbi:MAG: YihA family ribosome biogenesis GTP-binding protein [Rhodothermales bacterium]|nr:YihA family ribosome biogenesis GTP-binding protein [Rhodothermales bacterium]
MLIHDARFIRSVARHEDMPTDRLPEVTFVGRSNVGKSSLINMLLGRKKLALTSSTPGKTQLLNYYLINDQFYLVDVPGFGYAKAARTERNKWSKLVKSYLASRTTLRVIFQLIDSRHPPTSKDVEIFNLLRGVDVPHVILLTKCDKLSGNSRLKAVKMTNESLGELGMERIVIPTSAKTALGKDKVWEWLETFI